MKTSKYKYIVFLTMIFLNFCCTIAATDDLATGEYAMRNHVNRGYISIRTTPTREVKTISISDASTKWSLFQNPTGFYTIRKYPTNEYLDGGNKILQLKTSETPASLWLIESVGEYYAIKNTKTGFYLEGISDRIDMSDSLRFCRDLSNNTKWRFLLQLRDVKPVEVPDVTLDTGEKWKEWSLHQTKSTCVSHAVSALLGYVHGVGGIMPNYLHKFTQLHKGQEITYDKGHSIEDVMTFAHEYGVPVVPEGKKIQYETGNPFPEGTTKYGFQRVENIMEASWFHANSKIGRIQEAIRKGFPVVTGSTSSSLDGLRMDNHFHPTKKTAIAIGSASTAATGSTSASAIGPKSIAATAVKVSNFGAKVDTDNKKKTGHALILWGYDDRKQVFYVKNSWGDADWARQYRENPMTGGNAYLPYEYVESWTNEAYIGWGKVLYTEDYEARKKSIRRGKGISLLTLPASTAVRAAGALRSSVTQDTVVVGPSVVTPVVGEIAGAAGVLVEGLETTGKAIDKGIDATRDGLKAAGRAIDKGIDATRDGLKAAGEAIDEGIDATRDGLKAAGEAIDEGIDAARDGFKVVESELKNAGRAVEKFALKLMLFRF